MHPPLQTQLYFLNQAVSFLTLQVSESKQRSETLQSAISEIDKKHAPEVYWEALIQKAREDRKLETVECELERVNALVELFRSGAQISNEEGGGGGEVRRVLTDESFSETKIYSKSEMDRRERNLLKFLQTTTTFSSSTLRARAWRYPSRMYRVRQPPSSAPAAVPARTTRVMTQADVLPMRARTSRSLDFTHRLKSSLPVRRMEPTTDTFEVEKKNHDTPLLSLPPVRKAQFLSTPTPESKLGQEADIAGTATIFAYLNSESYARCLCGSVHLSGAAGEECRTDGNVEVELPAYAKDLFDAFDNVGTAVAALGLGLEHYPTKVEEHNEQLALPSQTPHTPSRTRSIRKTLSSTPTKLRPNSKVTQKRASLPPNFVPFVQFEMLENGNDLESTEMRGLGLGSGSRSSRSGGSATLGHRSSLYLHPDSAAAAGASQRSQRGGGEQQSSVGLLQTKRGGGSSSLLSIPESSLSYSPSGYSIASSLGAITTTGTEVGSFSESKEQDEAGRVDSVMSKYGEGQRGVDDASTGSPTQSDPIVRRLKRTISMSSSRLSAVLLRSPGKNGKR